jgi:protein-ribulosamine 3-kinase
LNRGIKIKVEEILSKKLSRKVLISEMIPLGGGCINECYKVRTSVGQFFIKVNDGKKFPAMFEAEEKGLRLLGDAVHGIVPEVIASVNEDEMILVLEWIEQAEPSKNFWDDFARKLASIHRHTAENYGLNHDNYMGSLPQSNKETADWISFFILQRIEPQLKKAIDEGRMPKEIHRSFDNLFALLPGIFPPGKPSLLHGDLWSGNFMRGNNGQVRLVDPAVYFGHREMDLSMTKLFGGFDRKFYDFYNEYFPLEPGFEGRVPIYNLYPLLIHVNLFGGHYGAQVIEILKEFSR